MLINLICSAAIFANDCGSFALRFEIWIAAVFFSSRRQSYRRILFAADSAAQSRINIPGHSGMIAAESISERNQVERRGMMTKIRLAIRGDGLAAFD